MKYCLNCEDKNCDYKKNHANLFVLFRMNKLINLARFISFTLKMRQKYIDPVKTLWIKPLGNLKNNTLFMFFLYFTINSSKMW